MTIKEKIELLNKKINTKSDALKDIKLECEKEQSLYGKVSDYTTAEKTRIETEWENSIQEYNKLREQLSKSEVNINSRQIES